MKHGVGYDKGKSSEVVDREVAELEADEPASNIETCYLLHRKDVNSRGEQWLEGIAVVGS